jgi:hypothetical protein
LGPETRGLGAVEPAIGIDRHAVVAPRLVRADQAVEHVVEHLSRFALSGIAEAAAARQLEADRVARRDRLAPFRPDRLHPENLGVARLDLLGLRQHCGGIGAQYFDRG